MWTWSLSKFRVLLGHKINNTLSSNHWQGICQPKTTIDKNLQLSRTQRACPRKISGYCSQMQSVRNWLFSKKADLLLLFLPVWLTWGFCFVAPQSWLSAAIPIWVFVVFVLGIDVSHVWSTIFRTYLDREEFRRHRSLLLYSPLVCFTICFLIAAISQLWFWRILTYVAIFYQMYRCTV